MFHVVQYFPALWCADEDMCGASTLVHAIDGIRRRSVARNYLHKLHAVRRAIDTLA